jgi:RNA polymerase sigma-70 factor (ECF subfamily)
VVSDDFAEHRRHLFGIAYRMVGSVATAEDLVQEAFLRWQAAPRDQVSSPRAYLSTVVTRLCLDHLKSARVQRESYDGPWLPEPVATDERADADSISMAFLVLLERLTPAERAAYLLHEVFDYSHADVAAILGKEEQACRQLCSRARRHVVDERPRFAATREQHRRLLGGFLHACAAGNLEALRGLLADDVTFWSDGGGKARAARKPVRGADAVARFVVGVLRKGTPPDLAVEIADYNGWPALLLRAGGHPVQVVTLDTDGERIRAIRAVLNPDKLRRADARGLAS